MNACCSAFSSSSSSTIIRPARLPKRRNSVPLPTPAAAAMSSVVTGVGAALGDQAASGVQQQTRDCVQRRPAPAAPESVTGSSTSRSETLMPAL